MTPPVQVPVEADSSWPTLAVPEMVGFAVLTGAELDETSFVTAELALDEPSALVAVTPTRIVWSTSALASA